jgi:hypothetical protein
MPNSGAPFGPPATVRALILKNPSPGFIIREIFMQHHLLIAHRNTWFQLPFLPTVLSGICLAISPCWKNRLKWLYGTSAHYSQLSGYLGVEHLIHSQWLVNCSLKGTPSKMQIINAPHWDGLIPKNHAGLVLEQEQIQHQEYALLWPWE